MYKVRLSPVQVEPETPLPNLVSESSEPAQDKPDEEVTIFRNFDETEEEFKIRFEMRKKDLLERAEVTKKRVLVHAATPEEQAQYDSDMSAAGKQFMTKR
jgi:hypothetical protein